jgi:hypothetical protein
MAHFFLFFIEAIKNAHHARPRQGFCARMNIRKKYVVALGGHQTSIPHTPNQKHAGVAMEG